MPTSINDEIEFLKAHVKGHHRRMPKRRRKVYVRPHHRREKARAKTTPKGVTYDARNRRILEKKIRDEYRLVERGVAAYLNPDDPSHGAVREHYAQASGDPHGALLKLVEGFIDGLRRLLESLDEATQRAFAPKANDYIKKAEALLERATTALKAEAK